MFSLVIRSCLEVDSSKLEYIALSTFDRSRKFNFSLQRQWVSRNDNVFADQLSYFSIMMIDQFHLVFFHFFKK